MPSRRHHPLPMLLSIVLLALLSACSPSSSRGALDRGNIKDDNRIAPVNVTTALEVDGQMLVELPLGSRNGIGTGDFFRIYSTAEEATLKGVVTVTEIVDGGRCMARLVGPIYGNQPLAPGDKAHFVTDLSQGKRVGDLESELRQTRNQEDHEAAKENKAFTKLREHYERKLKELHQEQRRVLDRRSEDFATTLAEIEAAHKRSLQRQRVEHKAELTALQASLTDEAKEALREERRDQADQIKELRSERDKLRTQVLSLNKEIESYQDNIRQRELTSRTLSKKHQAELVAEVESRKVLEERISELESRLAGRIRVPKKVLTQDANRNETILERLHRLTGERDAARNLSADLDSRLKQANKLGLHQEARITELEAQLAKATGDASQSNALQSELESAKSQLRQLKEHSMALELAQLRTERAYYDLSARILHLPDDNGAVRDLQKKLRNALDAAHTPPQDQAKRSQP